MTYHRHPNRYLHVALTDLVLGVATACIWQDVLHLPKQEYLPDWLWPVATAVLLLSALAAYARHRNEQTRRG